MPNGTGYAGLKYRVAGQVHQAVVQLQAGTDPVNNAPSIIDELQDLATNMQGAINTSSAIYGYLIYNYNHELLYEGTLSNAVSGTGPVNADYPLLMSATVTLTGKGDPSPLGVPGGTALFRWVCSGTFGNLAGVKALSVAGTPALASVAGFLTQATFIWADFYGLRASVRPFAPVQYNAALQKRIGS